MGDKRTILIVDDNIDAVELLRKRLGSEGYATAEAYDGEECLERVSKSPPDLIILDVMMPKLDGYGACQRLKSNENTKSIPILMLTAKSEVEDKVKGLDIGADDYLAKPFDYKELSARVRSLLSIKAAHEKLVKEEKTDALKLMMDEVTHEVRNPLVSIGGFARRVYESLPEGSLNKKYMDMIIEEVKRLEDIVKQLIDLQTMSISFLEPTNINDVIREDLDIFGQELEEKAIDVETELMDNPPLIPADQEQLKKAFGHIIRNAIESMVNRSGTLEIISMDNEGCLEVRISDTGKGISRDKLKNIFDPLFTSKIYGPGLGLTFAYKIMQAHRGNISVESESGKGTTFTIRLPIRKP